MSCDKIEPQLLYSKTGFVGLSRSILTDDTGH